MLVGAVIFGGGYFYYTAHATCNAPVAYHIGTLDPQFGLSSDEARTAISAAESLWEDATGRNLFSYDADAEFTVNFIYDARQAHTDIGQQLGAELEKKKNISDEVRRKYEELLADYRSLTEQYERKASDYKARLITYNEEVATWNTKGGAPEEVYTTLATEKSDLAKEQDVLNAEAEQLNQIVRDINDLGEQGNGLVSAYNSIVEQYNSQFGNAGHSEQFTQGDYQGDRINIYEYENTDELEIVLAHELGHALGLDHVEGEDSIMYYLMGEQNLPSGLTVGDLSAFDQICGRESFTKWPLW